MDNRKHKRDSFGLCYRCEHRARYFETGSAPRAECGSPSMSVYGCYMYKPVRPVVVTQGNKDDPRPIFGPSMIAGRIRFDHISNDEEVHLELTSPNDGEFLLVWAKGALPKDN